MTDELVIRIADLREAMDRALRAAEAELGSAVALPGDYYWHLPVDAAFDMTREPAEFAAGQLTDDLAELTSGDEEIVAVWHELEHLIGLVRAVQRLALP